MAGARNAIAAGPPRPAARELHAFLQDALAAEQTEDGEREGAPARIAEMPDQGVARA